MKNSVVSAIKQNEQGAAINGDKIDGLVQEVTPMH